jgi:hypothetical protein
MLPDSRLRSHLRRARGRRGLETFDPSGPRPVGDQRVVERMMYLAEESLAGALHAIRQAFDAGVQALVD